MIHIHTHKDESQRRVVCIAVHCSLVKIAIAREGAVVEVWEDKSQSQRFTLHKRSLGIRETTPRGLFWDSLTTPSSASTELLVMATLSGQFITYCSSSLNIHKVSKAQERGFFAVAMEGIFLDQTRHMELFGLTSMYAAAMHNGCLHVFSGAPDFDCLAIGISETKKSKALSVCFGHNGKYIFVGNDNGHVLMFKTHILLSEGLRGVDPHPVMPSHAYQLQNADRSPPHATVTSLCASISTVAAGTTLGDIFILSIKSRAVNQCIHASKSPILCMQSTSDQSILVGARDRTITLTYQGEKWSLANKSRHSSDISCIESSHVPNDWSLNTSGTSFLYAIGVVDGQVFLTTGSSVASWNIEDNQHRALEFPQFKLSSQLFRAGEEFFLAKSQIDSITFSRISYDQTRFTEPFARASLPQTRKFTRFITLSINGKFLVIWNYCYLKILVIDDINKDPKLSCHAFHQTSKEIFTGIQDMAFGYSPNEILFIAMKNEVFTICMESAAVCFRFGLASEVHKLTAQGKRLGVLCQDGSYVVWDDNHGKVILGTTKYTTQQGVANQLSNIQSVQRNCAQITDILFLHFDPFKDYAQCPQAVIFVNSQGEIQIISIHESSWGKVVYPSKAFSNSVFPLPGENFRVACAPVCNPQGQLLKDTIIFVFSSSHVALFELTKHYRGGKKIVRQKVFEAVCHDAFMGKNTRDYLAVLPVDNTSMIVPLCHKYTAPTFLFL